MKRERHARADAQRHFHRHNLDAVNRDDTPADDRLLDDLRARLDAATTRATEAGSPDLGTVELTLGELDRLLEMYAQQDDQLRANEFVHGRQACVIRKRNAKLDAITLAVIAGGAGPLADTISKILYDGR